MKRLLLLGLLPVALGATAQTMDHSKMPGMVMPGDQQKPTKKTAKKPAPVAKSAAGKSASPSKPSGAVMDHSAMPGMTMPADPQSQGHSSMPGMKMKPAQPSANHSAIPGMNKPASNAWHVTHLAAVMPLLGAWQLSHLSSRNAWAWLSGPGLTAEAQIGSAPLPER